MIVVTETVTNLTNIFLIGAQVIISKSQQNISREVDHIFVIDEIPMIRNRSALTLEKSLLNH